MSQKQTGEYPYQPFKEVHYHRTLKLPFNKLSRFIDCDSLVGFKLKEIFVSKTVLLVCYLLTVMSIYRSIIY